MEQSRVHEGFNKAQSGPHANEINMEIFRDLTSALVQTERHTVKERGVLKERKVMEEV